MENEKTTRIQRRLEHWINPYSSELKRKKLTKRIDFYLNRFISNPSDIYKIAPLIQIGEKTSIFPENTEENQAMLAGLFFALNRQEYPENSFLKDKEQRQIQAVAAFLSGFHLQMGAGEGKSTVVFPIVALVESLTNQKHSVVLATSDESNLDDLQTNIFNLINQASEYDLDLSGISLEKGKLKKEGFSENLQRQMAIEGLTGDNYSQETEAQVKKEYWQSVLEGSTDTDNFIYKKKDDQRPKIILATDRDLVFSFAENREKFITEAPEIYMDEADIPYNRKTPYKQTSPTFFFTPQEIQNSTLQWLTNRLIWQQLKESDFQKGEMGYELTEESVEKIKKMSLSEIIKSDQPSVQWLTDQLIWQQLKKSDQPLFDQAIGLAAGKLGLTEDQVSLFRDKFVKLLIYADELNSGIKIDSEVEAGKSESLAAINYEEVAKKLAGFYKKSGVFYKSSDSQKGIVVRDHYIDQILEDHHFTPDDELAILAIEGKYDLVQLDQSAKTTLTFQSFINATRDKLHCASGTLKFPDPNLKKIVDTNFSRFLVDYTGRKIYDVTQPEIKDLPNPKILENDEETILELAKGVEALAGKKPTLVISYDIESSNKIFNRLKQTYGERVQYVPTKPSNPKEVINYNKMVKEYYRQLADGEIDVLVSSGASGFAINIIKSDRTYPDLHITLHNLPANRQLLMQNLTRRRKEGSNFSWYISKEYLDLYKMMFEEKTDLLSHFLGKKDQLDMEKTLKEIKEKPELALPLILNILKQAEIYEAIDDQFIIAYDNQVEVLNQRMNKVINDKLLESKALRRIYSHNIGDGRKIFDFFKTFASQIGLPAKLYEDLRDYLSLVLPTINDNDMKMKLVKAVNTETIDSILKEMIDDWFEKRFDFTDESIRLTNDQVVFLHHSRLNQTVLFKPLALDVYDAASKNHWGYIKIQGKEYLGYKTPKEQVCLLTVYNGQNYLPLYPNEWIGFPYQQTIHGFDQHLSVVLFDFLKK